MKMRDVLGRFWTWATRSRRRAVVVLGALIFVCVLCPLAAIGNLLESATPTPETEKGVISDTLLATASSAVTDTPRPPATLEPTATFEPTSTSQPTLAPTPMATSAPMPTVVPTLAPTPTAAPAGPAVRIMRVNKVGEYVDLVNEGSQGQDLAGWVLVSERGNQRCNLGGVVQAGATLRVHAGRGTNSEQAYYCGYGGPIWNNSERDPAVLLGPSGVEVDRK